jgi:hypothetical protein
MTMRKIDVLLLGVSMIVAPMALADTYVSIDFPGALSTDVSGISASGDVVGTYTDSSNVVHGFRLHRGTLSTIDYPGAVSTSVVSVDSSGEMAGFFLDTMNQYHGFVLSGGRYFVQDYPGATTGTFTLGIGANGTLVGEFKVGQTFGQLGFAWILRHGRYDQLIPPGSTFAFATAVNARGDVVGRLIDATGGQTAWKLDKDGSWRVFQVPGATLTNARGMNDRGEIVGVYRSGGNHGFVLGPDDAAGFVTIDFPGAVATRALGINACGDIVGTYGSNAAGTGHGFVLLRDERDCDAE